MIYLRYFRNEDKARKMEKTVIDLVEESSMAYEKNDSKLVRNIPDSRWSSSSKLFQALEKAEEAMRNEKSLNRYREEQNLGETDLNLTGFVRIFNPRHSLGENFLYNRSFCTVRTCSRNVE